MIELSFVLTGGKIDTGIEQHVQATDTCSERLYRG